MEQHYFDCQCSDFSHAFRFVHDEQDGDLWLEVQLDPSRFRTFWDRLKLAFNYVFRRKQGYAGHYDTTLLRDEDYARLHDLLDRSMLIKRQPKVLGGPRPTSEKPVLKG